MTEQKKPCHNCRRRRLRCDRSVPVCYKCSKTGQTCLGYGQLYRWIDPDGPLGQAIQGQSTALTTFTESEDWSRSSGEGSYEHTTLTRREHGPQQTLNIFLADPLLQDLSGSSRYYLSYCMSFTCLVGPATTRTLTYSQLLLDFVRTSWFTTRLREGRILFVN
jgi:hypothetical protein